MNRGFIAQRFALLLVVICAVSLVAEKKLVTVDDYFTQAFVVDCEIAPDARHIAYVELRWEPPRESRNADIWIVNVQTEEVKRLTFESAADVSPQWSVDSRHLYFASRRKRDDGQPPYNGKTQVWRVSIGSGQVTPVTRLENGISSFELSADSKTLYYTVAGKAEDDEWKSLRKKHSKLRYARGTRNVSQLWKLDLQHWRAEKLVDEKRFIREFAVAPHQGQIAMITADDDLLITHEGWSRLDVYDTRAKRVRQLPDDLWRKPGSAPHGWLEHPCWSSDSSRLAFRVVYDGYPAEIFCARIPAQRVGKVKRPAGVTVYGGEMMWSGDDLLFQGQWRARERVYRIANVQPGSQGRATGAVDGEISVGDFSVSANGRHLATVHSTPTSGRDVYSVNASEPQRHDRMTETNPQMKNWKLPQISIVKWKGANDDTVEGILELPPGYKPSDGPLPTIVHIHGGPTSATPYAFRFWPYGRTLLPSQGYALLSPNYHGSTGYGDKFMTDLVGKENDIEVTDILRGTDMLVSRGIADPKRLGVMGWSNGGFLTNAVITKTHRFKAASSGAGVIDQVMQWGLEDTPGHVVNFMSGRLPWENPEEYEKASPLFGLNRVTTPTLIHVGENDARVPAAHARTLFRALHRYRKVPTQLVVYPGAGHSPLTYSYRKAKMEWDLAWFKRYLK